MRPQINCAFERMGCVKQPVQQVPRHAHLQKGIVIKGGSRPVAIAGETLPVKYQGGDWGGRVMGGDMDLSRFSAKSFLRSTTDFLWPPRGLISGARGAGQGALSTDEFLGLSFITGAICRSCGTPCEIDLGPETQCPACIARPPRWTGARAALVYDETSRRLVLDLKRSGRRDGLCLLAGWMAQAGKDLLDEADILLPVPLHYTRLVTRGFNQSGWLAQEIGRATGVPVYVDALRRKRRTPSQGGLSARARRRNVAGAFAVRDRYRERLQGKTIVLIDDVLTTGATLSACTSALKRAGVRDVYVLVLARVVRPVDATI